MATLADYNAIEHWLGSWLQQLVEMGDQDDYQVILSEIGESEAHPIHLETLRLLDNHIQLATQVCRGFALLIGEKSKLPVDLDEANKTVLDKFAEIRGVAGLHRLGFRDISFNGSPDLRASRSGRTYFVEVTRLGYSEGKRSKVWDEEMGSLQDDEFHVGLMYGAGASVEALSEAIYREIEEKSRQLKRVDGEGVLWISLGRDYLTAGRYELPGVGLLVKMSNPGRALADAIGYKTESGLYASVSHVVVSLGRDLDDLVFPELSQ